MVPEHLSTPQPCWSECRTSPSGSAGSPPDFFFFVSLPRWSVLPSMSSDVSVASESSGTGRCMISAAKALIGVPHMPAPMLSPGHVKGPLGMFGTLAEAPVGVPREPARPFASSLFSFCTSRSDELWFSL